MKDNNDGNYSASFVTKHVGEVKLSVTIKGQHILKVVLTVLWCTVRLQKCKQVHLGHDHEYMGKAICNKNDVWALTCDNQSSLCLHV